MSAYNGRYDEINLSVGWNLVLPRDPLRAGMRVSASIAVRWLPYDLLQGESAQPFTGGFPVPVGATVKECGMSASAVWFYAAEPGVLYIEVLSQSERPFGGV